MTAGEGRDERTLPDRLGEGPRLAAPEGAFEHLAVELATTFLDTPAEAIDGQIEAALQRVATALDLDRSSVVQRVDENFQLTHQWVRPGFPRAPTALVPEDALPWLAERVLRRQEPVVLARTSDLPPEASKERALVTRDGVRAHVSLPLVVAGQSIGFLAFGDLRREREWSAPVIDRLRLIAHIVASALARKEADRALRRAHAFETLVAELSTTLAAIPMHSIDQHVETTLHRIGDFLGADRAAVLQASPDGPLVRTHQWVRDGGAPVTGAEEPSAFPWLVDQLFVRRAPVVFARLDELPPEAGRDREGFARLGVKAGLARPLVLGDRVLGALVFAALRAPQRWPSELVDRLRLVSELVASGLARHRAETGLRTALAENERLRARLEAKNRYLQNEIREERGFEEIVGQSASLRVILRQVDQVATTGVPVLLLGETGTGKELIARTIHARSGRGAQPFIAVNCAALPPALIESELFGHEKGAFTGATQTRLGRFELADGSTLFLDEIGDLEPALQVKLLRVLQDGEIQRLGASRDQKVDVRILAATNRDLDRGLRDGRFREDLYYRLSVFPITLPPLRERREDIPLLVWHCIQSRQRVLGRAVTDVPPAVMQALVEYDWPGNVRELQNVIDRALILSTEPILQIDGAFALARRGRGSPTASDTLEDIERAHIVRVLDECGWVLEGPGQAAERLGLRPSTLRHRMKTLRIDRARRG